MYSKPELRCRAQAELPPYVKAMIIGYFPDPRPFFRDLLFFRIETKKPPHAPERGGDKTKRLPIPFKLQLCKAVKLR